MSCTNTCVNTGIKTLEQIVQSIIQGAQPQAAPAIIQLLTNAFISLQCELPPNIIQSIVTISSNTASKINTAYIIVIFVTLFILISIQFISNFLTPWWQIILYLLSILVMIGAAILLSYWVSSVYATEGENLKILLNNVVSSVQEGFCCLGSCSTCKTCPLT